MPPAATGSSEGRFLSPSRGIGGEEEGQRTKGTQRGIPGEINTVSEGPRVSLEVPRKEKGEKEKSKREKEKRAAGRVLGGSSFVAGF